MTHEAQRVVVADTNVIINLCIAGRLDLLEDLPSTQFVVPMEVQMEMQHGRGRRYVGDFFRAMNQGYLRSKVVVGERALKTYLTCVETYGLGTGESAGLALAFQEGYLFATVDAAAFKHGVELLGTLRVVHLEDILEVATLVGRLSETERTDLLRLLEERNNYRRRA